MCPARKHRLEMESRLLLELNQQQSGEPTLLHSRALLCRHLIISEFTPTGKQTSNLTHFPVPHTSRHRHTHTRARARARAHTHTHTHAHTHTLVLIEFVAMYGLYTTSHAYMCTCIVHSAIIKQANVYRCVSVSYTHLTLPTNAEV